MAIARFVAIQNSDDNSENAEIKRLWNYQSGVPGATDDSDSGFAAGDLWINSASDTMYVCSDATVGAAVWTAGGAPLGTVVAGDYTPAQTVLVAVADQTPLPQVVGAGEFVGRPIAGNVGVITAAQARAIINASSEAEFDTLADAGIIDGDRLKANGLDATNFNAATADGAILPRKNLYKSFAALGAGDVIATSAQLVGGVLTVAAAAANTLTVDVAADIIAETAVGVGVGKSFEFTVVNSGAGTSTVTAPDASVTITGSAVVAATSSATFLCVVTGAANVVLVRK